MMAERAVVWASLSGWFIAVAAVHAAQAFPQFWPVTALVSTALLMLSQEPFIRIARRESE